MTLFLLASLGCSDRSEPTDSEAPSGGDSSVDTPDDSGDPPTDSETGGDSESPDDTGQRKDTDPPVETGPIVVYWVIDTAGAYASADAGYCDDMRTLVSGYGLEVDCREGGVSPSSWTLETYLRTMWPSHTSGASIGTMEVSCDDASLPARLGEALGAASLFGMENARFNTAMDLVCDNGSPSWLAGLDFALVSPDVDMREQLELAEADRSSRVVLEQALERAEKGESVVVWLNDFQAGGHFPRCWYDVDAEACDEIWDIAVEIGLVKGDDNRYQAFIDSGFWSDLQDHLDSTVAYATEEIRDLFWKTTVEAMQYGWENHSRPRLERLFAGLHEAGRLDDLVLIVTADHGEAPCVDQVVATNRNCSHAGLPSEWTAQVPTYIVPRERGEAWEKAGFVAPDGRPWSLVNLSYALMNDFGGGVPKDWPTMTPVGTATSLNCFRDLRPEVQQGIVVLEQESIRCVADECGTYSWTALTELGDEPEELRVADPSLVDLRNEAWSGMNWISAACSGVLE